jgi:hypothetical protein
LTVPSAVTEADAVAPVSGCHTCVHAELEQMNFPLRSPLRLYSVIPWASTRIVLPSFALGAVLTTALDASLTDEAPAG